VSGEKLVSHRGEKIAMTEQFTRGVDPHIRASGDIADTPGCTLEFGQVCFGGIRRAPKHQAQTPSSGEAPNLKLQSQARPTVVAIQGSASRIGAWSLGFEASQRSHSTENSEEPWYWPNVHRLKNLA